MCHLNPFVWVVHAWGQMCLLSENIRRDAGWEIIPPIILAKQTEDECSFARDHTKQKTRTSKENNKNSVTVFNT